MTATAENKLYLDYAATTPVRTAVQEAMRPYWQQTFANPQSQHEPGRAAGAAVAAARTDIETALGVKPSEIIFTSGATEANTLAVRGTLQARQQDKRHLMIGANSHPSLLQAQLPEAVSCTQIPLTATGRIDLKALRDAVSPETALISVPYVDSEIGSVQPLKKIARQLTAGGDDNQPLLHADASQAGLYHSLSPELLGVDLMTVNGHKLYGPKGVGFLWVRSGTPLSPVLLSEKQHLVGDYQALRPGTPPTPLIVGLAAAVTWAQDNYRTHRDEVRQVRDYGIRQIKATFP